MEDDQDQQDLLQSYIQQYSEENEMSFSVETFPDGRLLLDDYSRSTTLFCWTLNCPE